MITFLIYKKKNFTRFTGDWSQSTQHYRHMLKTEKSSASLSTLTVHCLFAVYAPESGQFADSEVKINTGNVGKSSCSWLRHCLAVFVQSWDSRGESLANFPVMHHKLKQTNILGSIETGMPGLVIMFRLLDGFHSWSDTTWLWLLIWTHIYKLL